MLKQYLASPKRFKKADFSKIGSGTGELRYAFGMYMGEKNTALKYYEDYAGYGGADIQFIRNGAKITEGSPAFKMAKELYENDWDIDGVKKHIETFSAYTDADRKALKILTSNYEKIDFTTKYAAFYEVTIPNCDINDFKDWDSEISEEELNEIAVEFHNMKFDVHNIEPSLAKELIDLGVEFDDEFESTDDLIERLFDEAYNYALEEDMVPSCVDEEELKVIWDQKVRNDNHATSLFDDEFDEAIDQKYLNALAKIVGSELYLEKEMTYGDAYMAVSHALNPNNPDVNANIEGKKKSSEFFSKNLNYLGFRAPSKFGDEGAMEIIVVCEDLASKLRLEELGADVVDERNLDDGIDYDY